MYVSNTDIISAVLQHLTNKFCFNCNILTLKDCRASIFTVLNRKRKCTLKCILFKNVSQFINVFCF